MLGSFYEKAWAFGKEASAQRFRGIRPAISTYEDPRHPSNIEKNDSGLKIVPMHLKRPDTMLLGDSVMNGRKEYRKSKNVTAPNTQSSGPHDISARPDEISLPIPLGRNTRETSDIVVASWIILAYRYQRDTFDGVSWRYQQEVSSIRQRISALEVDLPNLKSTADIINRVRDATSGINKSSDILPAATILSDAWSDNVS
jgi:hypothetical protein